DAARGCTGLVRTICSGEALPAALVERFNQVLPGVELHNLYGPTEAAVDVTAWACPQTPAMTTVPIGSPIANTRIYVLDALGEPVPVGVAGEIHIGGVQVARGYLNRDQLTVERFVPDPFVGGAARMYRTGDLGRWLPDGNIEYLGRNDFQVKIRGFRIELGEIEARLVAHPGVREAVVVAREDTPGNKRIVAYYVAADDADDAGAPRTNALRDFLLEGLPDYMVPAAFVRMQALPLTSSGKRDRKALPAPGRERPDLANDYEPALGDAEGAICAAFAQLLDLARIGRHDNFFELGGNSLLAARLLEALKQGVLDDDRTAAARAAGVLAVFRNPTPAALASALASEAPADIDARRFARSQRAGQGERPEYDPIAIIAVAGRFPGAADVETFWRNVRDGLDTITFFGTDGLDPSIGAAERADPDYVPARGIIDDVEQFDAAFFGVSPREAELMDPQHRIFLELCWECMERAGHVPGETDGPVGVFAGTNNGTYMQRHVSAHPELVQKLGAFQVMVANEKDYISTRVAHKLDLTGPAISIHTACSTSLVAICQAVDSLRAGQCDMALAGAASVTCPPRSGYSYQEGGMLSPDGHTRAFDAAAQGTVFGDGAAVLLLKRLSDALADGDQVYALIRGGAINNDGGRKASFTAPSSDGQAAVIAMAHRNARVDPRSISYVEAHGTGTPLGDPIEIEGLTKAFRRGTDDVGFCRVGSVKSNVGHLVAAAGAAGVIKTALSLRDRVIPGTAHFTEPNPAIAFEGSPFTVSAASVEWESDGAPRRAGVSSFGVGGTNAHVVMEQAPERVPSDAGEGPHLLPLSARTPHALGQVAARLASHLEQSPDTSLADVAWTLAAGRKAFAHRVAVVAANPAEAVEQLRSLETTARIARSKPARESDVVFLFPGQGSQYAGMGRELYRAEPVFREAFDACADAVAGLLPADLRELVFGDDADALLPTGVMQPAIFAVEYATARLWMDQGLRPAAMIGHSIGEFVAATIAGVFEPAEAMRLVARRGALMQAQPAGGMLSVRLPLDEVVARLPGELSLAVENGAAACVVSGPHDAIARFRTALDADGVACRELKTSHAFHSAMMEPVVAPFRAEVEAIARSAPALPIVSTATGDWLDDGQACSPDYWATHLRAPVRFASALARVIDTPARVVLEVGPRTTLTGLARQAIAAGKAQVAAVASLSDAPAGEVAALRLAAGQLWSQGAFAGIDRFDRRANRHRVRLPTYPFERQRYWVEAGASAAPAQAAAATVLSLPDACPAPIQAPAPENIMSVPAPVAVDRRPRLTAQLKEVFEDVAGFDLSDADEDANFIELGLDSLNLTQVALQLQKTFAVKVTFRQLMAEYSTLRQLAQLLDEKLPADAAVAAPVAAPAPAAANNALPTPFAGMALASLAPSAAASPMAAAGGQSLIQQVIQQQMQVMAQQLAVLSGQPAAAAPPAAMPAPAVASVPPPVAASAPASVPAAVPQAPAAAAEEDTGALQIGYDVKKSFGAIARIHTSGSDLDPRQQEKLRALIDRYVARTPKSKAYTQEHRAHMADPRVVSGFRPLWKEIVYQTVVARSKGSRLWDIDGNEYIDASNGFGMSLFGWQPDFVLDAVREQLEQGYEIGPQHPLAGEVARLVCEMTGHDRAGLCNTGSEAVLGALRIARTVTGRNLVAVFGGSYHGINDEVVVRGNRKMRAIPGAPGILRNACEHVLVLDYGTPEALQAIREHAHELAAVLVEPVQSRRPDLQPVEFLREVRAITAEAGAVLIFDEVITGFRAHPGGAQALFGIKADLATYGKVIGGGYPLGVVAGKREYMDALDGGHWQYGDDSMPTVGVTYFAGTFVRHPLALAATKASLEHLKAAGPGMQERLNARTAAFADEVNAFLRDAGAPIEIRHFASLWRTHWLEEHPLQDLLYAMIRSRGVHILDNFPCYFTTAHSEADIQAIAQAYKDSVTEMLEAEFLPRSAATPRTVMDPARPPVSGARLGREPDGRPAWFVPDQARPGKYLKVAG
ncbi:MAG TPA: aminotransferase class III-fold pyridoxal phosphate-dependent enzyme, partial [Luteimonas sp.]|nr:aminotransferase class III-fold pyridoxal phosphate-dependent enzyme [Luteimonas sp.]